MESKEVRYLVRGECEDYYCGCGGGHLLGIARTEIQAKILAQQATGKGTFHNVHVDGPFAVDELIPEDAR